MSLHLLAAQHFKIKNVAAVASCWQHCVRFEYSPKFELFKSTDPETNALPLMILIVLESDCFPKNFKVKENLRNIQNILLLIFHLFL